MTTTKLSITIILMLAVAASFTSAQHYYGGGNRIPLKIDSTKIMVKLDPMILGDQVQNVIGSIDRIVSVILSDRATHGFVVCSLSTTVGYDLFLDSVQGMSQIFGTEPFYLNSLDSPFVVGLRFCVAFDTLLSNGQIDSINTANGAIIDHEVDGMTNVFVLLNTESSGYRLLELANRYYEMDETRYSHPEFGVWIESCNYRISDEFADFQWQLKKVIGTFNDVMVWDFAGLATARPVTVAVIDDGIIEHEDLPLERILPGYDYADYDSDPTPGDLRAHGMACAGIISASHYSNIYPRSPSFAPSPGIFSMSPKSKILPVKVHHDNGSTSRVWSSDVAAAITYARTSGAEVISCSWAYPFSGYGVAEFDVLTEAIDQAAARGRGWKGCVVIFAAGNYHPYFTGVAYPAWLPSTFSVGATQSDDSRWHFSSHGTNLDIVAPSGDWLLQGDVWTLDQMSNLGFNPAYIASCPPSSNDLGYDCGFGGTSAAAPVVAGTAALLLAFDYTLTSQEVYDILRKSAVRELDWNNGLPIDTPHVEYGYGRVDAFRAILSLARGDMDASGSINLADITILTDQVYYNGPGGDPDERLGNCNCSTDGKINLADITKLIDHIYVSKAPLPLPCFVYEYPNQQ